MTGPKAAAAILSAILLACVPAIAQTLDLPQKMEPPPQGPSPAEASGEEQAETAPSSAPPLPSPRPRIAETGETAPFQGPPIPADLAETADGALPAAERQCRARLAAFGAEFEEHEPLSDPSGCRADHPITLTSFNKDVALEPPAVLSCAMAEASARFVRYEAQPLTREHFDMDLEAVHHVSAYVCRNRSGGGKLSEHAFANALDWGAVELTDGTMIPVKAYPRRTLPRRAGLMAALREAACGPFKTVLGPGTDAAHADHFHFDLAERRRGATYCR